MNFDREESKRTTYRLGLEYDGTRFQGWQLQPGRRTVQGAVEAAVQTLFGEPVSVIAAGRTDAGVHATGQVAHFRSLLVRTPACVLRALNALLPPDVRVKTVAIEGAEFHARYGARWRAYRYRIARRPTALGRFYCWVCPYELDSEAMRSAAERIVGEHSFRSFAHSRDEETHYRSTVHRAVWNENGDYLDFEIEANRFLHGMVRLLVGTFVDVGRGRIEPAHFAKILEAQDVGRAGVKAPPWGLTLTAVGYREWDGR